jgi:hypothetical protein
MLREINSRRSLHYWDWTQDPRAIPNANLGDGKTGTLNLFTPDFMGYGGSSLQPIGQPWLNAGFYVQTRSGTTEDRRERILTASVPITPLTRPERSIDLWTGLRAQPHRMHMS